MAREPRTASSFRISSPSNLFSPSHADDIHRLPPAFCPPVPPDHPGGLSVDRVSSMRTERPGVGRQLLRRPTKATTTVSSPRVATILPPPLVYLPVRMPTADFLSVFHLSWKKKFARARNKLCVPVPVDLVHPSSSIPVTKLKVSSDGESAGSFDTSSVAN